MSRIITKLTMSAPFVFEPIEIEFDPNKLVVFSTLNEITSKYPVFFNEKDAENASLILDMYNGKFVLTEEHLSNDDTMSSYANYFYAINDNENHIKYLTISANLGNAHSMANLAYEYHTMGQYELAEKYITMAHELDATYANFSRGNMYVTENPPNFQTAIEYYEKVLNEITPTINENKCTLGVAALNIGKINYNDGNEEKAIEYLQKSATYGNHTSIDFLVYIYEENGNTEMVKKYLKLGEECNNPLSLLKLSTKCKLGEIDKMIYYAEKGVAIGNVECMYLLGTVYLYVAQNAELMKKYLHMAVLKHYCCQSASLLGTYYFTVEKNASMAKNCLLLAIVKNNSSNVMKVLKNLFKDKLVDLYETLCKLPNKVEVIENEIKDLSQNEIILHYNQTQQNATQCLCFVCNETKNSITFLNCNHHVCLDCFKGCSKCSCETQ